MVGKFDGPSVCPAPKIPALRMKLAMGKNKLSLRKFSPAETHGNDETVKKKSYFLKLKEPRRTCIGLMRNGLKLILFTV